jgi:hypothetical protein
MPVPMPSPVASPRPRPRAVPAVAATAGGCAMSRWPCSALGRPRAAEGAR